MKVAIFTDNDFNKVNGVTTTLRAVLDYAPDDLDLRVYTCDGSGVDSTDYLSLAAPGIGIPFYREMTIYLPPLRRLLQHAMADGVEMIHLTTPGPLGLAAVWVASRLGLPMIGSFHTDLAEYTRLLSGSAQLAALMREYMRWPYGRCERVFAPSEATRDMLIRSRISESKIDIWRRGVSTERFDCARRCGTLREQWRASEARPVLLYVGRLSREKGLAMLGPASTMLRYAGVSHRLVLVGDGPMRQELQAACPEAVFMGTLSQDDVAVAMASADVFVFPSTTDTAGNVVLEAQASGLPVLVSQAGGPRENMRHGETGFVCNHWQDFVSRAGSLLKNAGKRERFGHAAREYAKTRRWEVALEPLYRAYSTLSSSPTATVLSLAS
jgi:glycosyltransferase involved in cell wall biosynthesis